MKIPGWAVAAAILLTKNTAQHIKVEALAKEVMATNLSGLGKRGLTPRQTLRNQLNKNCPHPDWFSFVGNNFVTLVDRDAAGQDAAVRAVQKLLKGSTSTPNEMNKVPAGGDDDSKEVAPVASPVAPKAADLEEPPPERVRTEVSRIVRDTQLSNSIKLRHQYLCQICGLTIKLADGSRYAEAHHLWPLGAPHNGYEFGYDVAENIVCLCPNHHAECDLGAIKLSAEKLRQVDGHQVGQTFLEYHNNKIYRG